ncbi:RNA dependent RNA polymerase [Arhar cryptic virus-I]|uniref:RNA dependent RNA polymerase n=1 Tax=Arhar cryptic virus-I TaxID=1585924 RepID=UPI0003E384DF|nr:RNA dependent RNA polymerase [Arhar cryptic virus-I]CDL67777.1 RNA dependent RNA polymerase [Arhar cryptic virus-I]
MDHRWRGATRGLIRLEEIPTRRIRDERRILIDEYASEAINRYVPLHLRAELEGWARSYYTLETHLNAIMNYDRPKLSQPSDAAWVSTMHHVREQFRQMDKVTALSHYHLDKVKWVRSSAAGYGYVGLKSDPGNYERARTTAFTIAERLNHERDYAPEALKNSTPDVAFTRTQLCQIKIKRKVRNVWGEAFHYVLLEGLFADPLIQHFMKIDSFYFIGQDPLLAVPYLIEDILSESDYVYMFDWSGFDSSVHEWEIRFAFELLESLLVFPSSVEQHVWRFIIELFIYRKIASPNGVMYLKTQGIPSGSCFTNIIGSITNYVRIQYIFRRLTNRFANVFTHGDDSLAGVSAVQFIPMENIAQVCAEFNWTINVDKSDVSRIAEAVTFLSRNVREMSHARDELTCLRMLKYPEYPVESGAVSTLRALSISKDAGLNSHYLYKIYKFLDIKYGKADSLPLHHKSWDPLEYESLRLPYSQ